jgi:alpha-glucosidase
MAQTQNEIERQHDLTEATDRTDDVISRHRPDVIDEVEQKEQQVTFITENNVELIARVITPEIIRLTYFLEGDVRSDFSYATDPDFQPPEADYSFGENKTHYEIETDALRVTVSKKQLLVDFYDTDGNALCEDEDGFYRRESLMEGISELKVTKKAPRDVQYFGLGDKAVDSNLRGRAYENWATDSYAYERGDDPLYRSIPFYLALMEGRGYGIFMDNTYHSRFSFDRKKDRVSSFSARGGVMNYYFIYGPDLTAVTERYTRLTGTPEMPPMWALGYHQCRWSYFPEDRVREVAAAFRKKEIPCDAIYLDIDYMDGYRCFTWNEQLFPDPGEMISELQDDGFKTVVMIDPGIKVDNDYFVYKQGIEEDFFCKRPDGELVIAPVWPAKCAFPEFTNPKVRQWWADLYEPLMSEDQMDIAGVWNDMNEPAVFEVKRKTFPDGIRHDFDGHPCSHKKAHNIYGMQMARASLEGMKKHRPEKRPFLLTRANFSGGQRYAALWTGDNIASWDHLKLANEQCQRLSISGYSFVGTDIGGFVESPDGELMSRWLQLGVFHPLFRNHTMGYNLDGAAAVKKEQVELQERNTDNDQEPWVFGKEFTAINRETINLRYRLLAYIYTAFYKYVQQGTPILKPLAFADREDEESIKQNDAFLFGEHILVAPVLEKEQKEVEIYLPEGRWYDFRDGKRYQGGTTHSLDAPVDRMIPFLVMAGSVLPLREVMQYTGEREPKTMQLNIYHGFETVISRLYEDAEEGWGYKNNEFRITNFEYRFDEKKPRLKLSASREGNFEPAYDTFEIRVIGLPFQVETITADGSEIEFKKEEPAYTFSVPSGFEELAIQF